MKYDDVILNQLLLGPVMAQEHKRVTVNASGCEFDAHS